MLAPKIWDGTEERTCKVHNINASASSTCTLRQAQHDDATIARRRLPSLSYNVDNVYRQSYHSTFADQHPPFALPPQQIQPSSLHPPLLHRSVLIHRLQRRPAAVRRRSAHTSRPRFERKLQWLHARPKPRSLPTTASTTHKTALTVSTTALDAFDSARLPRNHNRKRTIIEQSPSRRNPSPPPTPSSTLLPLGPRLLPRAKRQHALHPLQSLQRTQGQKRRLHTHRARQPRRSVRCIPLRRA